MDIQDGRLGTDYLLDSNAPYRAFKMNWTGYPTWGPSIAVVGDVAYLSWNGATEVTDWAVVSFVFTCPLSLPSILPSFHPPILPSPPGLTGLYPPRLRVTHSTMAVSKPRLSPPRREWGLRPASQGGHSADTYGLMLWIATKRSWAQRPYMMVKPENSSRCNQPAPVEVDLVHVSTWGRVMGRMFRY